MLLAAKRSEPDSLTQQGTEGFGILFAVALTSRSIAAASTSFYWHVERAEQVVSRRVHQLRPDGIDGRVLTWVCSPMTLIAAVYDGVDACFARRVAKFWPRGPAERSSARRQATTGSAVDIQARLEEVLATPKGRSFECPDIAKRLDALQKRVSGATTRARSRDPLQPKAPLRWNIAR